MRYLSLNYGAVLLKNVRKCINVQCLKFFGFPQLIRVKLDFQSMRQQNLNIVTDCCTRFENSVGYHHPQIYKALCDE